MTELSACPFWCRDRTRYHRTYDTNPEGALIRTHSADTGTKASVIQDEYILEGCVVLMPGAVHSHIPECEDMTAREARAAANDLRAAADRLEQITSEGADR